MESSSPSPSNLVISAPKERLGYLYIIFLKKRYIDLATKDHERYTNELKHHVHKNKHQHKNKVFFFYFFGTIFFLLTKRWRRGNGKQGKHTPNHTLPFPFCCFNMLHSFLLLLLLLCWFICKKKDNLLLQVCPCESSTMANLVALERVYVSDWFVLWVGVPYIYIYMVYI